MTALIQLLTLSAGSIVKGTSGAANALLAFEMFVYPPLEEPHIIIKREHRRWKLVPFAGLIFDVTSSWVLSFYLAGGWIVVAGVLISFIHPVKKYQLKRAAELESDSSMA